MGKKTKLGKGRQDKFYHLAKAQGYRSRAAYKLIQLNRKYNFLESSRVCLDLCAAPGGWLQVASKYMPLSSVIIGVDLVPIRPVQGTQTFQGDITTQKCRRTLRQMLKGWKADIVVHDGAPNVGSAWVQDAYDQSELTLHALRLATDFLCPGGVFVTKVFRSADYNALMWVFKQLFKRVDATKPAASRNTSAEIFVVCRGYLAPSKIDPRLLDPAFAFKEVLEPLTMKKYWKMKQKANRSGYTSETVYKEGEASEFLLCDEPVKFLAQIFKITFNTALSKRAREQPECTKEFLECCQDIQVLGKGDFARLLAWRETLRERFGIVDSQSSTDSDDQNDQSSTTSLSVEEREALIDKELDEKIQAFKAESRRKRKKRNARRRKLAERMNLGMHHTIDTGDTVGVYGIDVQRNLFSLSQMKDKDQFERANMVTNIPDKVRDQLLDEEAKRRKQRKELEKLRVEQGRYKMVDVDVYRQERAEILESQYADYLERKGSLHKLKKRGKPGRLLPESSSSEEDDYQKEIESQVRDKISEHESLGAPNPLLVQLEDEKDRSAKVLSRKLANTTSSSLNVDAPDKTSALWFSQPVFSDLLEGTKTFDDFDDDNMFEVPAPLTNPNDDDSSSDDSSSSSSSDTRSNKHVVRRVPAKKKGRKNDSDPSSDGDFEVVPLSETDSDVDLNVQRTDAQLAQGSTSEDELYDPDAAVQALAFAQGMINKKGRLDVSKITDLSYNRWAVPDSEKLPMWLEHEETAHFKPIMPTTKGDIEEMKLRQAAIDARPIKKIAEAKARKKRRTQLKMSKLKEDAKKIAKNTELNDDQKMRSMERLAKKQMKMEKRPEKAYVVRKKFQRNMRINKVPGARVKCVDKRLRNDKRARKRFNDGGAKRPRMKRSRKRQKRRH